MLVVASCSREDSEQTSYGTQTDTHTDIRSITNEIVIRIYECVHKPVVQNDVLLVF